jgi:hypothetical protein
MMNLQSILIDHFVRELETAYHRTYGLLRPEFGNVLVWCGHQALENIANSDALYHNMEHTMMVTLVGQEIIRGKHLIEGGVTQDDWLHYMLALLFHDIGYVRGVCRLDEIGRYATGEGDQTVSIPPDGTDAALTPYHVSRSKLFVRERFSGTSLADVDADRVASYIEMTRFPVPEDEAYLDISGYPGLTRAADFIGQLADPGHLRKIPALFYEFEETGANRETGYRNPGDMRRKYARFFWNIVNPYIEPAIRYLQVTQEGKQWISSLHAHIFSVEHAGRTLNCGHWLGHPSSES